MPSKALSIEILYESPHKTAYKIAIFQKLIVILFQMTQHIEMNPVIPYQKCHQEPIRNHLEELCLQCLFQLQVLHLKGMVLSIL